jgi:Fic family protein
MLPPYLIRFNQTLADFQIKFPKQYWTGSFKSSLINDYTFYSSRVEDARLEYGDTIRFLDDQLVKKEKLGSLLDIANHKNVLQSVIDRYDTFELSEDTIKSIHKDLMSSELSWDGKFKPELVGNYRNIPTVGYREPLYPNKEYVPHFNLEFAMPSNLDLMARKFENVNNSDYDSHLLTALAYFHNIFLNKLHPFADGNGRVCRIIMGTIMMKHNCPPVFSSILSNEDMMEYITAIIVCEKAESDEPFVEYLANGMADYLGKRIRV